MIRKRIDLLLVEKKLFSSREQAQSAIEAGDVLADGCPVFKPSSMIDINSSLTLIHKMPYVSRGGLKLEGALKDLELDPKGNIVVDVGSSTGGFTDCLLQKGATKVYAVDVGYGQLDVSLRNDPRVRVLEKQNFRFLDAELIDEKPDLVVVDVAFISVKLLVEKLLEISKPSTKFLILVKPQFEAGKKFSKKGVVKDPEVHISVLQDIRAFYIYQGFHLETTTYSPIKGPKGNIEFFYLFSISAVGGKALGGDALGNKTPGDKPTGNDELIKLVESAHENAK